MRIPATTKVTRAEVEADPLRAATKALAALQVLKAGQERRRLEIPAAQRQGPASASYRRRAKAEEAGEAGGGAGGGGGGGGGKGVAGETAAGRLLREKQQQAQAAAMAAAAQGKSAAEAATSAAEAAAEAAASGGAGGVAKLGYSWEANDVLRFHGPVELAGRLQRLFHQAQGNPEFAFVQDLIVDFDCEVRTFVVKGVPMTHRRRYTAFATPVAQDTEDREAGRYSHFERGGRDDALERWLGKDARALADAEAKVDALIERWCEWLRGECCDLPTVFRFDAFLRRNPATHTCDVFSGELTELGACTLGWEVSDMVATLFPPVLSSMLDDGGATGHGGGVSVSLGGGACCAHPRCRCRVPNAPFTPAVAAAHAAAGAAGRSTGGSSGGSASSSGAGSGGPLPPPPPPPASGGSAPPPPGLPNKGIRLDPMVRDLFAKRWSPFDAANDDEEEEGGEGGGGDEDDEDGGGDEDEDDDEEGGGGDEGEGAEGAAAAKAKKSKTKKRRNVNRKRKKDKAAAAAAAAAALPNQSSAPGGNGGNGGGSEPKA